MATPLNFNYKEAFSRNLGLVTDLEQEKLKNATIAIPGMGGVGGIHLMTLTRLGVGGFHIADGDRFELANFNRQFGATMSHLGLDKTDTMVRAARDVNPELRIKKWNEFITEKNVTEFLQGCDLVVDSLDAFCLEARRIVFSTAQKMNIPVVTAGPIGFSCSMLIFDPKGMSFDDYINYVEGAPESHNFLRFLSGLVPRPYFVKYMIKEFVNPDQKRGPSVSSAVTLCAGFASVEALKIILGRGRVYPVPHYHYYDPYLSRFKIGYMPWGNKNPIQKLLLKFMIRKYTRG